jgi:hypothetical protein
LTNRVEDALCDIALVFPGLFSANDMYLMTLAELSEWRGRARERNEAE